MSIGAFQKVSGMTMDAYEAVAARVYADPPEGLVHHAAWSTEDGEVRVFDVWEDQAARDRFARERLGPAFAMPPGYEDPDVRPKGSHAAGERGTSVLTLTLTPPPASRGLTRRMFAGRGRRTQARGT